MYSFDELGFTVACPFLRTSEVRDRESIMPQPTIWQLVEAGGKELLDGSRANLTVELGRMSRSSFSNMKS